MKRIFFTALSLCMLIISITAQKNITSENISDNQWQELFTALDSEDWNTAFELSDKYIKILKDNDEADSIANLRYMYLYAAAGKVSVKKMSYDELEKIAKRIIGKKIVFPFRPIAAQCTGNEFNFICPSTQAKRKVTTVASNKAMTSILAFEYTQLKEDFNFEKHVGEPAAIGGVVESIVPNPNRSTLVILRIFIADGYIILKEQIEKN